MFGKLIVVDLSLKVSLKLPLSSDSSSSGLIALEIHLSLTRIP
jgi:hypothetical protein